MVNSLREEEQADDRHGQNAPATTRLFEQPEHTQQRAYAASNQSCQQAGSGKIRCQTLREQAENGQDSAVTDKERPDNSFHRVR